VIIAQAFVDEIAARYEFEIRCQSLLFEEIAMDGDPVGQGEQCPRRCCDPDTDCHRAI
jgi:hypothetical protein